MKKYIFTLILILSIYLCASCGGKDGKDSGTTVPVTEPEAVPVVTVADYSIVYPDCMGTYAERFTVESFSARRLQRLILDECGVTLDLKSDAEESSDKEIRIGNARGGDITADAYSYNMSMTDGIVTVAAGDTYSYFKAFETFVSFLEGDNNAMPEKLEVSESGLLKADNEKDFIYIDLLSEEKPEEYAIKKLTVNGNDISEYSIVYHVWGDNLSPHYGFNEKYAAEKLQSYIKFATGIELPIVTDDTKATKYEIVVGTTNREGKEIDAIDREEYGEEATLIKTEGERLIITGGARRGTLYAAYTFLEDYLGIRFYADDCEVVYKADSIDISNVNEEYIPIMEYRDNNQKSMHTSEYAVKRKINSSFCRTMNYYQGGTFTFAGDFVHTMGTIFDLDNAMNAGQPCFTDEATFEKALEGIRTLLSRSPDCKVVSMTQNDIYDYCVCSGCAAIIAEEASSTGPLIYFINRLADGIKDDYPDVKIMTLAYMFSLEPPKTAPRDNVVIMYCPIESCCACALDDPDCSTNREYADNLEGWLELTDNVYVWYYVVEFIEKDKLPFMNFDALYDTYEYFKSVGVKGVFNEAWMNSKGNEFDVMRAYLLSNLLWDNSFTREE